MDTLNAKLKNMGPFLGSCPLKILVESIWPACIFGQHLNSGLYNGLEKGAEAGTLAMSCSCNMKQRRKVGLH